jgi:orotate phosphoribosyltransferase
MTEQEVIDIFKRTGALLEGHFIYASGRHGSRFLQASRVLQYPAQTEALCKALAGRFADTPLDAVCGPATGGILLAYETARHLGCRSIFSEKDEDGGMSVRRGFRVDPGARILVVEDIITTGGSVRKTIDHLRERGAEVVGVGGLIDRSGGQAQFDCRFEALARIHLESWDPAEVPRELMQLPVMEPDDLIV